jgi:hypothetical protein
MLSSALVSALFLFLFACQDGGTTTDSGDTGDSGTGVVDAAPEVTITSPDDGASYSLAEEITLAGSATDMESDATELTYAWSSSNGDDLTDLDGSPGSDGSFSGSTTGLSAGSHTLTVTVWDPGGNSTTASVIVSVSVENVAPSCEITAPSDGDSGPEGGQVDFEATATDAEDASDTLTASLDSDVEGNIWSGSPGSNGSISASTSDLRLAAHTITLTVTDSSGAVCNDSVVYVVGGPPEIAIAAPYDGEEINEGEWYSFTATVTDEETALNDLKVAWTSDVDGEFTSSTASAGGLVSPSYGGLSPGEHVITATVTDDEGLTASDTVALTVNGVPTAPELQINPDPASADDELFAIIVTDSTDPEGDSITYTYQWYRYAVLDTDETTDVFPASKTGRGVTFKVRVTPNDGKADGQYGEAELIIGNGAPIIGTVDIDPDPPQAEDILVCTYGGFYDPDGDGDYSTLEWFINGTSVGTAVNLRGGFVKGDTIGCTATPYDGSDTGDPVSAEVIAVNSAPEMEAATISPDPAHSDDSLTCVGSGFYDADGDTDVSTTEWFINGSSVATTLVLPNASGFVKGDEILCEITPDDGQETGTVVSDTTIIQNSAPSLSTVDITPTTAQVDDTLECAYKGYSDTDGDPDQSTFSWTIDGIEIGTAQNLSGWFSNGETVTCTVTPFDGEDEGTPGSDSITISNTVPEVSDVIITPDPADADDTLTCSYSYSDADGEADASTLEWLVNGTSAGTEVTLSGAYVGGDTVQCTVTAYDGTDTGNSESDALTIGNGIPSVESVSIDPILPTGGDTLTCSYSGFYDADGDADVSTLVWDINGSSAGTSADLTGGFASGDLVTCTITPDDGIDEGDDVSTTVVIDDQPPVIADAAITPDPANSSETLTCVPGTTTDPDGTTEFTYSYSWEVNGLTVATGETLSGAYSEGDNVKCLATPNDGQLDGNTADSQVITVTNGPPVIEGAVLSTEAPGTQDILTVTVSAADPDGDSLNYTYIWYIEGKAGSETSSDSLDLTGNVEQGDQVYVEVVADDGSDSSDAYVSNVATVSNTPPAAPELSISPTTPGEGVHDFQCVIDVDSDDIDGDAVTYAFSWEVDGVPYTSASTTDHNGDTVLAGEAFEDEEWVCTVVPNDGIEDGDEAEASATIGPECGAITSVDTPTNHLKTGSTYGQWFTDPEQALGEHVYVMDSYNGSTITQYDDMDEFENGTASDSWTLTYSYDGTGAVAYNGYLYYNQANTRNMVQYDLASHAVVTTVTLTNAGYRNTYHYGWGGYSDIDFSVDENGLWVLYSTSANSGKLVVSKLSEDLDIEDTWNTNSEAKTSMGNAFVVCGLVYAMDSYSGSSTTLNYVYDTSDSSDSSESISISIPGGYSSSVHYNYLDQELWAWDYSQHLTYGLSF